MIWISTQKAINESPEGKFKELELFSLEKRRLGNIKKKKKHIHTVVQYSVFSSPMHIHTYIQWGKCFMKEYLPPYMRCSLTSILFEFLNAAQDTLNWFHDLLMRSKPFEKTLLQVLHMLMTVLVHLFFWLIFTCPSRPSLKRSPLSLFLD